MTPLYCEDGFIICFEASPETIDMRRHFMGECGWSREEYNRIRKYAWFTAEVTAWKDGECLGQTHLGACCYKNPSDFWKGSGGYFPQMVEEVLKQARGKLAKADDPQDQKLVERIGMNREQLAKAVSDHYTKKYATCVSCFYSDGVYVVSGSGLPAATEVKDQYPNGWSLYDTLSEEEAINIVQKGDQNGKA